MKEEIRRMLAQHADEKYREFSAGLLPGARPLLGVRLPRLRKIAKAIVADGPGWQEEVLETGPGAEDIYFEETMLRGMMIGHGTAQKGFPCEEGLRYLEAFIPFIDNWSVCDSFCSSFVFANRNRDAVWRTLQPYLYSDREYEVRAALILLLTQYLKYDIDNRKLPRNRSVCMADINDSFPNKELSVCTRARFPYLERILSALDREFDQGYYAQMAAAWLLAETFVCFPYEAYQMLSGPCRLDAWTYAKALQKIRESLNPDKEVKETIAKLKKAIKFN